MKKLSLSKKFFVLALIVCSCVAQARTTRTLTYRDLKMKEYDEMEGEVKRRLQSAEKIANNDPESAKTELKLALLLIFSRPDTDNMVTKLVPLVRPPLRNLDGLDSSLTDIVNRAIVSAKDKKTSPAVGATSLIVLENFMGEMQPDIKNSKVVRGLYEKIRDANIIPSKDVTNELRMRASMKTGFSPSETAKLILKKESTPNEKHATDSTTESAEEED